MRLLRKRRERPRTEAPNTSHPISNEDVNVLAYLRHSVLPRQAAVYDQYVPSRLITNIRSGIALRMARFRASLLSSANSRRSISARE